MEELQLLLPVAGDDAAAFVLSRLPHPGTTAADAAAFIDATTGTGTSLSFSALRRAVLSLASALRLGRGDTVVVLSRTSLRSCSRRYSSASSPLTRTPRPPR